jgi:hypothetical protein
MGQVIVFWNGAVFLKITTSTHIMPAHNQSCFSMGQVISFEERGS